MSRVAETKISQRELAARWKCSQPYIAKLVKRGMPTTSEAAAAQWRDAQSQRGVLGGRTKAAGKAPAWQFVESQYDPAKSSGFYPDERKTGLVAEVDHLRATVAMFRSEIAAAKDLNSRTQATRNYTITLNTLRQFEKELPEILKSQDKVCDYESVQAIWRGILETYVKRLRDLPARAAPDLVSLDEDEIQKKLETEVEYVLSELRKDWGVIYAEHQHAVGSGAEEYL